MTRLRTHAVTARFAAAFYLAATLLLLCSVFASAQEQDRSSVRVIHELKHDVSAPLAELERMTPAQPHHFSPRLLKTPPPAPVRHGPATPPPALRPQPALLTPLSP